MADYSRIRRIPERGRYDRETLNHILDECLVSHVSFVQDGQVFNIPMLFARDGDSVILHTSVKSRIYETLSVGVDVCLATTIVDGIVVAKSAFHSSMNYRSALIFGKCEPILGEEKMTAAYHITEKIVEGRWNDCRLPKENELKSTGFLRLKVDKFSCKIRGGGPVDDKPDTSLPHWSGVIPLSIEAGEPETSETDVGKIDVPSYVASWRPKNSID